jgi:hypothetical protein
MKGIWSLAVGLLVLSAMQGCQSTAKPSLAHPRSAEVQQKRALRYDPYPETNVGPGMSETRPRDYQNPPAETSRARWERQDLSQYPNSERWNTNGAQ